MTTDRACFSGIYPHLAVTNEGSTECGIGAVVEWAGKLWFNTYAASGYKGDDNKLYTLDGTLQLEARAESVGGTHANRFVHRESGRLFIGMYVVDGDGAVFALDPVRMHGRMTGVGRHLTDPANKVILYSMEDALYEVDIRTLEWKKLAVDLNEEGRDVPPDRRLPGDHGKGGYSGQGRFVITHNGIGGVLAEWDGSGDPQQPESWVVVDRNKYTDITGPGCIFGEPSAAAPLWALGWDEMSVLLNVRDAATDRWHRYRLPKSSAAYDADHGWFTEWPRIRDVGGGHGMLMDMHGMFFRFPAGFRPGRTSGIVPLSRHLKMIVDFASWNGRLVAAANDATRFDNPLLGRQQSNLWFTTYDELASLSVPEGWGGVWLRSRAAANGPSEPFLTAGFERIWLHLAHDAKEAVAYTLEADIAGDGSWRAAAKWIVPASGYLGVPLPTEAAANWVRLVPSARVDSVTAYFHLTRNDATTPDRSLIEPLPSADRPAPYSAGVVRPMERNALRLQLAANRVRPDGTTEHLGYYEIGEEMKLSRLHDPAADFQLRRLSKPTADYEVDAASVLLIDIDGRRYRLPRGSAAYDRAGPLGLPRAYREVVTERSLMNAHGTFFELPRPESGGFAKMKPVCTHNRLIYDFCSWRGMLVLSGVTDDEAGGHVVRSEDGDAALWFGNVDDLWKFGAPSGEGGPCRNSPMRAGEPSDPYLMLGYKNKTMQLSHAGTGSVAFNVQIDFLGDGTWHSYGRFEAASGEPAKHVFPDGFSAHWMRVVPERDCTATVWLTYN